MHQWPLALGLSVSLSCSGCASWNKITRHVTPDVPARSDYIESRGPHKYACSFVEFDGKGDLLAPEQVVNLENRLRKEAAAGGPRILLVFYCHGWRNNAQSGDVAYFIRLLQQTSLRWGQDYRVEGVYFAWRGNPFKASLDSDDEAVAQGLEDDFGGPVIDKTQTQPLPHALTWLPETLSEFVIQHRAEYEVSHLGLAQALFSIAFAVKAGDVENRHHAFVIGHSFGALLLERAIGPASIALLEAESTEPGAKQYWPFDLVVFLNAAAPSLYAKQVVEFLDRLYPHATRPMFVSITSTADSATGFWFPVANLPKRVLSADLKRQYYAYTDGRTTVTAGEFYDVTAGHSPRFVAKSITLVEDGGKVAPESLQSASRMDLAGGEKHFKTNDGKQWDLRDLGGPAILQANAGLMPRYIGTSNYWVISVDKNLISGHNDVWNEDFTEILTGICSTVVTATKPDRFTMQ
jgi:hypothetical protein